MYNLIITIISILLVLMLSLASAYYSGNTVNLEILGVFVLGIFAFVSFIAAFLWGLKKLNGEAPDFWSGTKKRF